VPCWNLSNNYHYHRDQQGWYHPDFLGVLAGDVFTIQGPFNAETSFFSLEGSDCFIYTSCSAAPLVTNDQNGPLKMLAGNECHADPPTATIPPVQIEICEIHSSDNKNKQDSLTLQYEPTGINSMYQDSGKVSYPTTTRINSSDIEHLTFDVTRGDSFTIFGPFSAETTFTYNGWWRLLHPHLVLCSIGFSDQIGLFIVTAGNECGRK
jgi:hypothetical protein